jgi:lipocalin
MKRFRWVLVAASTVVAGLILTTAAKRRKQTTQMSTVPSVDLARYAGRWYEVANSAVAVLQDSDYDPTHFIKTIHRGH